MSAMSFFDLFDLARDALELGECLQTIVGDLCPLIRIVAVDDVGRQAVDVALERRGK